MTLIASLLFAIALFASVGIIMLTVANAMPRINQIIEMEFAPVVQSERRIFFGEVKGLKPAHAAQVVAFPRKVASNEDYRLAA